MGETPLSGTPSVAIPSVAPPSVATPRREPAESGPEGQDFDRLIEKGLGAAFARDYRGAAAAFEEALRLRPGDSRARFNLERVRGFLVERGRVGS